MKEKFLEILANLGFQPDAVDEWGVHFEYDDVDMVTPFSEDEEFLTIIVPGIVKKVDNPELFDTIISKLNADIKYVKAYDNEGLIWLCYERECINSEITELEVEHMIIHLYRSYRYIGDIIRVYKGDASEVEDDNVEEKEE